MASSKVQAGHTDSKRQMIHLLIADESLMHCQLLKAAFRYRSSFRVVASAVSRQEIISAMNSRTVDIALINESLQEGPLTGFGVLSEVHSLFPKTRLIASLKSAREDLVIDGFRAGVKGVFCRSEPLHLICKCIIAVRFRAYEKLGVSSRVELVRYTLKNTQPRLSQPDSDCLAPFPQVLAI